MTSYFWFGGLQESSWSPAAMQHRRHELSSSNWFCGLQILLLGFCLLLCYVESVVYHCLQYISQYSACQVLDPQSFWFVEDAKVDLLVVPVVVVSHTPLPHTQDDRSHFGNLGDMAHCSYHSTGAAAGARRNSKFIQLGAGVVSIRCCRSSFSFLFLSSNKSSINCYQCDDLQSLQFMLVHALDVCWQAQQEMIGSVWPEVWI